MNGYFKAPLKESLRRRLAMPLLALGLLAAGKLTYDETPREQPVQLDLPEALRADLTGVRLTYMEDDEAILGTEQRFSDQAPSSLRSAPSLAPGDYRLAIELAHRGGEVTRLERRLRVPSEGTVHIRVSEPGAGRDSP
ncbi:MAG TPA: hypothetical protein VMF89_11050 [Polyangiales bacterium]|nr:hypothetical protein [Polyangiales bacterium]